MYNIFSSNVYSFLNYINHCALIQEWKLNIDAPAYEKQIDANVNRPSDNNKFIIMIAKPTRQSS